MIQISIDGTKFSLKTAMHEQKRIAVFIPLVSLKVVFFTAKETFNICWLRITLSRS